MTIRDLHAHDVGEMPRSAPALNGDAWRVNWSRIRSWCVASIKCPSGAGHCLEWIYFGYADDTPEMRKRRLRHLNLGRPAGFVSM
jgi:hypothetical protein